ncbi:MAG: hypothetical protein COA79_17540 [Planctomycetota bacterium]|nr:MAG: hypothetical protein COA79_17540 [Planctomycetota bacterium]
MVYRKEVLLSITIWNKDGTLNKKEYYDPKGIFQKRELFEKGKLVKIEVGGMKQPHNPLFNLFSFLDIK